MLTKNDLSSIQKLVRGEVQDSEKRLSTKIDKVQESVDIVQSVVVEHYGKLEKRVENIEEELNIPKN
ncbi:MAG: hypothetical protein Q8P26_03760 [Candidatus Levybacteria bacterium]|nr:hypothetical protein [Candidatus Levybacteria bacterium]